MTSSATGLPHGRSAVQRQISLPLSKAIEIVWKNIRIRLGRSLLVTSGILLATAFLMSVLTAQAVIEGLGHWTAAHAVAGNPDRPQMLAAQELATKLTAAGASASADSAHNAAIQTRWLVALALLVAFIGILNAMLMSVTERFREIGTMKCLGALDSFIIKLFLLESLFQGSVGSALGVVIGAAFTLGSMTHTYGTAALRLAGWHQIMVAAAVTVVVGIVLTVAGALYPAWQAARMQPIEAMRADT